MARYSESLGILRMLMLGRFDRMMKLPVMQSISPLLPSFLLPSSTQISVGLMTGTLTIFCSLTEE
jgi:hypothetical protein